MAPTLSLLTTALTGQQAFAQGTAQAEVDRITSVLKSILGIVDLVVIIAVGCAFLFFFWGLASFIYKSGTGGSDTVQDAKNKMFWGVIGIFVLTSIWGIIYFLKIIVIGSDEGDSERVRVLDVIQTFRVPAGIQQPAKLPCPGGTTLVGPGDDTLVGPSDGTSVGPGDKTEVMGDQTGITQVGPGDCI